MKMTITGLHKNGNVLDSGLEMIIEEWDERIAGLVEHLPAQLAEQLLAEVVKKAPSDIIKGYPKYMAVRKIGAEVDGFTVYGVLPPGWAFSQRLRSVDVQRTVLYVRPKVVAGVTEPAAVVLSRKNPWTMDTLPYEPSRREASLLARQVSEREVRKIEKLRSGDRAEVVRELKDLGKPIRPKENVMLTRRVTRDLFFEVTRIEFGVERSAIPHWRPATQALTRVMLRKKVADMMKELFDPDSAVLFGRKNFPDAPKSVVKNVQRFQDMMMPSSIG